MRAPAGDESEPGVGGGVGERDRPEGCACAEDALRTATPAPRSARRSRVAGELASMSTRGPRPIRWQESS
ncbi:hypothetical protein SF23_06115 [Streptomyces sp. MBRL 10]|nr:hypothetical protein SF23_06115 [Streptomyces sp. MBRL 10]